MPARIPGSSDRCDAGQLGGSRGVSDHAQLSGGVVFGGLPRLEAGEAVIANLLIENASVDGLAAAVVANGQVSLVAGHHAAAGVHAAELNARVAGANSKLQPQFE